MILDGQARPDYLLQSHHGAECFCTRCLIKGRIVPKGKGHVRIFEYNKEDALQHTHSMSEAVAQFKDKSSDRTPFDGIKGKSPLYDVDYLNIVEQIPSFESMHTIFGGTIKKLKKYKSVF